MTSKKKLKRQIRKLECQLSCLLDMSVERELEYLAFRREHEVPRIKVTCPTPELETVVNDETALLTAEALAEANDEDELERVVRESRARMASLKRTSDAAEEDDIVEMLHDAERVLEYMAPRDNCDNLNQSLNIIRAARVRMDKMDKSRRNPWETK